MTYTIKFDPHTITIAELEALAKWLAKKGGGRLTVGKVIEVKTDNDEVGLVLKALSEMLTPKG